MIRNEKPLNFNNFKSGVEINTNCIECSPRGIHGLQSVNDRKKVYSLKELLNLKPVSTQRNNSPLFKKKIKLKKNCLRIKNFSRKKNNDDDQIN